MTGTSLFSLFLWPWGESCMGVLGGKLPLPLDETPINTGTLNRCIRREYSYWYEKIILAVFKRNKLNSLNFIYRMADNYCGVAYFVIDLAVLKFSTHENNAYYSYSDLVMGVHTFRR